ncbi:Retrovirus-related Pol polyprotein from transposon TNT 1-94 [Vitis vinifera]|uniref:Retrovirus-related Pol polyprotein from transposon TNT 1-94 n=1 Tax=Vitis vinifera TaxID=29760 RepID=A0A438JRX8_VITVI|nr:Retrovirus-related Pol polyprotein from transposon TNT 1-94 [Vitis vinifera]
MLSTHFDMKDLGEAFYVLGIKILRDRANGVLKLSQRAYIERILKRFNMHNCKSTKASIVKGDKFSKAQCPQNDDEREEMKTIPYSSVVGSLMYAQVCTRPDIAFVVGMLGRYLSNPGSQHWKAAKKVLRYLQGTKDLMLTYQRTSLLDVVGFCDADFAGCIDDKKSTTGYIFMMAGGAVSWKSVKQTLTASSTMEAEYVTCYETVAFSKNTRSISRSKHIDVKFYFVKEKVAESLIDIEHMSTKKSTHSRFGLNPGVEGKSSLTRNSRTIKHWRSFLNTRKKQEMAFHGINQVLQHGIVQMSKIIFSAFPSPTQKSYGLGLVHFLLALMPASVVFFLWWTPVTGDTNIPALNDLLIPFGVAFGDKILNGAFSIDGEHGRYAAGTDTAHFHSSHTHHIPITPTYHIHTSIFQYSCPFISLPPIIFLTYVPPPPTSYSTIPISLSSKPTACNSFTKLMPCPSLHFPLMSSSHHPLNLHPSIPIISTVKPISQANLFHVQHLRANPPFDHP